MIGTLNRVIIFVKDMPACAAFYKDVLGLTPSGYADGGWMSFDAGGCLVSLHSGGHGKATRKPKHVQLVFKVADVAAARAELTAQNVDMDEIIETDGFAFCNGRDPESNWFQISTR
jgi:predicted enzyme related to lactoylglutathione lyase